MRQYRIYLTLSQVPCLSAAQEAIDPPQLHREAPARATEPRWGTGHGVPCEVQSTTEIILHDEFKKVPASFYRSPRGTEPVRAWLQALDRGDRQRIGEDIATVEYGWPVGMPTARALGGGLWEVRTNLDRNRTARVIFCFAEDRMILLHAFMKTTQQTPGRDLAIARRRQKEIDR